MLHVISYLFYFYLVLYAYAARFDLTKNMKNFIKYLAQSSDFYVGTRARSLQRGAHEILFGESARTRLENFFLFM